MMAWLVGTLIMACGPLAALTRETRLQASGSWEAVTAPLLLLAREQAHHPILIIDAVCTARTGSPDTAMLIIAYPPGGGLTVQVSSPRWDFPPRDAAVTLRAGATVTRFENARYIGDAIEYNQIGPDADTARTALQILAEEATSTLDLLDARNRVLARFPANGMKAILRRTDRCAARSR
jgi:hypothetical protein